MTTNAFSFQTIPPVFKRKSHVVIAIFDNNNHIWLSRKSVYPAGIYRLFGGGVELGESIDTAVARELFEETRIHAQPIHQQTFLFSCHEQSTSQTFEFKMDLFSLTINDSIIPSDDVTDCKACSRAELGNIIQHMQQLSDKPFTDHKGRTFSWKDWGTVFSIPHQHIFDHYPAI